MFNFVNNSANNQTKEETLLVAVYELGKVIQCQHYAKRFGTSKIESMGYLSHGKTEMSDLISMLRMYCEQEGWDYDQLHDDGEKRYISRMRDLISNGINSELKKEFQGGI